MRKTRRQSLNLRSHRSHHPNSRLGRRKQNPQTSWGNLSSLPRYPLIYPDEDGYDTTGIRDIRLTDAQVDAIQDTLDTMRNDEKPNHDNSKGDAAL